MMGGESLMTSSCIYIGSSGNFFESVEVPYLGPGRTVLYVQSANGSFATKPFTRAGTSNAYPDANPDGHTYRDCATDANLYADAGANRYCCTDSHAYSDQHPDARPNRHCCADSHGYPYSYADTYRQS